MMLALQMYRSLPKYMAARAVGGRLPGVLTGPAAPLRLATLEEPRVRRPGWARVRPRLSSICGSDLGAITGSTSLYFSGVVSFPFVPGHEVVGELAEDCDDLPAGTRVVLDPILNSEARGVASLDDAEPGTSNRSDHVTVGCVAPGLQTGFCRDTGGGWGRVLAAHRTQLYPVPDRLPDSRAVLVEPLACAVHTAVRARVPDGGTVLVNGAGAVGLFATLALREFTRAGSIVVVAKHARQRELARAFGATAVLTPGEVVGGVRRMTRALRVSPERSPDYLLGGVDVAIDAVGSADSIGTALRVTRAGGRVVLSGMPAIGVDLSPVWFRELEVVGAYASARREPLPGGERDAFAVAMDLAGQAPLDGVLGATYPLHRWREAIDHAHSAGRLGTVKVAFDPRSES